MPVYWACVLIRKSIIESVLYILLLINSPRFLIYQSYTGYNGICDSDYTLQLPWYFFIIYFLIIDKSHFFSSLRPVQSYIRIRIKNNYVNFHFAHVHKYICTRWRWIYNVVWFLQYDSWKLRVIKNCGKNKIITWSRFLLTGWPLSELYYKFFE